MKKGFTLIELLAVIVILAIIALIAVPIVVNIINDSKKESLQRSIDLYMDHVQKIITKEQMSHSRFNPKICEIEETGNLICNGEKLKIEMKGTKPNAGIIKIDNGKIIYGGVVLDGLKYKLKSDGTKEVKKYIQPEVVLESENYRGYYADVDGDDEVDGLIYADLAHEESGRYYTEGNEYASYRGVYSYVAQTELKEYLVSKEDSEISTFGVNKVIKVKKDSVGNSRFYVMALKDFKTALYEKYYWYKNVVDVTNQTGRMNSQVTQSDFGTGKNNTRNMIEKWNSSGTNKGYLNSPQDNQDIWKHIQEKYNEGWYIPSSGEWSAFANYIQLRERDKVTFGSSGNYKTVYGLSDSYWTSTQDNTYCSRNIYFPIGVMSASGANGIYYVRLGTTF